MTRTIVISDADGGKSRAVAFHAVGHRRNGDKVVGLIVIRLVSSAADGKVRQNPDINKQIGGDDDQDHRNHKPEKCL